MRDAQATRASVQMAKNYIPKIGERRVARIHPELFHRLPNYGMVEIGSSGTLPFSFMTEIYIFPQKKLLTILTIPFKEFYSSTEASTPNFPTMSPLIATTLSLYRYLFCNAQPSCAAEVARGELQILGWVKNRWQVQMISGLPHQLLRKRGDGRFGENLTVEAEVRGKGWGKCLGEGRTRHRCQWVNRDVNTLIAAAKKIACPRLQITTNKLRTKKTCGLILKFTKICLMNIASKMNSKVNDVYKRTTCRIALRR